MNGPLCISIALLTLLAEPAAGQLKPAEPLSRQNESLATFQIQLSDAEKERIRLEEVYREEVRKALAGAGSSYEGSLKVLNSPFILWLLSSVVLAAVPYAYTSYRGAREKRRARTEKLERLLTDLGTRVVRARADLDGWEKGKVAWGVLENAQGAFPEYKERDFLSLVTELSIFLPGDQVPKQLGESWRKMLQEPKASDRQEVEQLLNTLEDLIEAGARLTSA